MWSHLHNHEKKKTNDNDVRRNKKKKTMSSSFKERAVIIRISVPHIAKKEKSERCNDTARSCVMRRHSKTDGLQPGNERRRQGGDLNEASE